jgi:hypothetical protein
VAADQLTVKVKATVCVTDPPVAVIVTLYVPAPVPDEPPLLELELPPPDEELPLATPLDEPPPPPQLPRTMAQSRSTVQRISGERDACVNMGRARRSAANGSRIPANTIPPLAQGANTLAVAAVVLMVSLSVTALPLTVAVVGENVQVAPLGSPEQLNETLASNPPLGVSVNVVVADFPGITVAAALEAVSANEGVDDAAEY